MESECSHSESDLNIANDSDSSEISERGVRDRRLVGQDGKVFRSGTVYPQKSKNFIQTPGVQVPLPNNLTPFRCFNIFLSDEFLSLIVTEAKRYVQ